MIKNKEDTLLQSGLYFASVTFLSPPFLSFGKIVCCVRKFFFSPEFLVDMFGLFLSEVKSGLVSLMCRLVWSK